MVEKVTGYGATQAEAQADANRKASERRDEIQTDQFVGDMAFAGGNLAITVIAGYLSFAWNFFLSFAARPMVTFVFGVIIFVAGYLILRSFGISGWASLYRENPFTELFLKAVVIFAGSIVLGGIATVILPITAAFEKEEVQFFRSLPFVLRCPLMVLLMIWPVLMILYVLFTIDDWSTVDGFGYFILFLIYAVPQTVVAYGRLTESTLSDEFNWYGAEIPDEVPEEG